MQVSGLGIPAVIAAPAISAGTSFFSKIFGGGGDVNYANKFSASVGIGKKFLQTEANAYYARGSRLGVSAFVIARKEFQAGRALSDNEILAAAGKAPAIQPAGFPSPFPQNYQAPSTVSWPLIIGGSIAVIGIGAALLLRKR